MRIRLDFNILVDNYKNFVSGAGRNKSYYCLANLTSDEFKLSYGRTKVVIPLTNEDETYPLQFEASKLIQFIEKCKGLKKENPILWLIVENDNELYFEIKVPDSNTFYLQSNSFNYESLNTEKIQSDNIQYENELKEYIEKMASKKRLRIDTKDLKTVLKDIRQDDTIFIEITANEELNIVIENKQGNMTELTLNGKYYDHNTEFRQNMYRYLTSLPFETVKTLNDYKAMSNYELKEISNYYSLIEEILKYEFEYRELINNNNNWISITYQLIDKQGNIYNYSGIDYITNKLKTIIKYSDHFKSRGYEFGFYKDNFALYYEGEVTTDIFNGYRSIEDSVEAVYEKITTSKNNLLSLEEAMGFFDNEVENLKFIMNSYGVEVELYKIEDTLMNIGIIYDTDKRLDYNPSGYKYDTIHTIFDKIYTDFYNYTKPSPVELKVIKESSPIKQVEEEIIITPRLSRDEKILALKDLINDTLEDESTKDELIELLKHTSRKLDELLINQIKEVA